jgi:hypothetical protein
MKVEAKSMDGANRRFADPHIIEFKPRSRLKRAKEAPIVDPLRQFEIEEDRLRMQQNLAAALVLILLLAAGLWIFHELKTSSRILACIEAGYRNCLPIDQQEAWRH